MGAFTASIGKRVLFKAMLAQEGESIIGSGAGFGASL